MVRVRHGFGNMCALPISIMWSDQGVVITVLTLSIFIIWGDV